MAAKRNHALCHHPLVVVHMRQPCLLFVCFASSVLVSLLFHCCCCFVVGAKEMLPRGNFQIGKDTTTHKTHETVMLRPKRETASGRRNSNNQGRELCNPLCVRLHRNRARHTNGFQTKAGSNSGLNPCKHQPINVHEHVGNPLCLVLLRQCRCLLLLLLLLLLLSLLLLCTLGPHSFWCVLCALLSLVNRVGIPCLCLTQCCKKRTAKHVATPSVVHKPRSRHGRHSKRLQG